MVLSKNGVMFLYVSCFFIDIGIQPTVFIDPVNIVISTNESTFVVCCVFGLSSNDYTFELIWRRKDNKKKGIL